jgi:hypothetical protein
MASPLNSWKTLQEEETPVRTGRASSVEAAIWVWSTACSTSSSGTSRLVASLTISPAGARGGLPCSAELGSANRPGPILRP